MNKKVYQDMEVVGTVAANELEITGGGTLGDNLKAAIKQYVNTFRYQGKEYYFSDDPTSPAVEYGGTWEQVKDRFILAAGDTYAAGSTGGSADAVVVKHTHATAIHQYTNTGDYTNSGWILASTVPVNGVAGNNIGHYDGSTGEAGESGTGKNMPPYRAAYIWHKIS